MPQPDIVSQVVRGPLADVSIAYRNPSYIADRVAPIIDRVPATAKIYQYLKGAWFRDEAGPMVQNSEAPRGGYPTSFVNVDPVRYGFAKEVTDDDRDAAAEAGSPPVMPDQDALEFCADKIDLSKEKRTAAVIFAATWCGVATGEDAAGLWAPNDATNTFIADVEARIETIRSNTGFRPNLLMLSANTFSAVKQLDAVIGRIQYVERGIVTAPLLAALFDLDECVIGDAIYSSAEETKAGDDFTSVNVWEVNAGKGSAFLEYRPPRPMLKVPAAIYQARRWTNGMPRRITTWREPSKHQDVYEVAESTDIKQAAGYAGFLWKDTIAT